MRTLGVLVFLSLASLAASAKFTTEEWKGEYDIAVDGTVSVQETISVTFTEPQRGLIRKFPIRTRGSGGRVRSVDYHLADVAVDTGGGFADTRVSESVDGGDWVLKIGDPNRKIKGRAVFRIDYAVSGAMTPFAQDAKLGPHAEFLWNLSPTAWSTRIERAEFFVRFPKPEPGKVLARILVGERGTRRGIEIDGSNAVIGNVELVSARFNANTLTIKARRSLEVGETVTLDLALPGDTVIAPQPIIETVRTDTLSDFVADPRQLFSWLGLLPLLGITVAYFASKGKWAPPRKPLTVQFDPPPGVGPSLAGLIMDGNVDQRDIVAGIVSLAQKGGLRMHHSGDQGPGVVLELLDPEGIRDRQSFDLALHEALAPFGPVVTPEALRGSFWPYYRQLVASVGAESRQKNLMVEVSGAKAGGCALAFSAVAVATIPTLCISPCTAIPSAILALIVSSVLVNRISPLTALGHDAKWKLQGLHEFISRAHQRELNYMSDRMQDQALFENLLPFAVAFNLTKQWAQAFEGIDLQMPDWYVGDTTGMDLFWTGMMVSDLMDFDQSFGRSVSYNPSTGTPDFDSGGYFSSGDSGFGGSWSSGDGGGFDGGFDAGGGGGGGGGDSW